METSSNITNSLPIEPLYNRRDKHFNISIEKILGVKSFTYLIMAEQIDFKYQVKCDNGEKIFDYFSVSPGMQMLAKNCMFMTGLFLTGFMYFMDPQGVDPSINSKLFVIPSIYYYAVVSSSLTFALSCLAIRMCPTRMCPTKEATPINPTDAVTYKTLTVDHLVWLGLEKKDIEPLENSITLVQGQINKNQKTDEKIYNLSVKIILKKEPNKNPSVHFVVLGESDTNEYNCNTMDPVSEFSSTNFEKFSNKQISEITKNGLINNIKQLEVKSNKLIEEIWANFSRIRTRKESLQHVSSLKIFIPLGDNIGHDKSKKVSGNSKSKNNPISTNAQPSKKEEKEEVKVKTPDFLSVKRATEFFLWLDAHDLTGEFQQKAGHGIEGKPLNTAPGIFEIKKRQWRIYFCLIGEELYILEWGHKDDQKTKDVPSAKREKAKLEAMKKTEIVLI